MHAGKEGFSVWCSFVYATYTVDDMAIFQIKIMKALEDDADYKLKTLKENDLDIRDIEEMKLRLKVQTKFAS